MIAEPKYVGTRDVEHHKIIHLPLGTSGAENLKNFALIYDIDNEQKSKISWLQSMEEPLMALPVINPIDLMENYNPIIEDELMKIIGNPADADILIFVTMTIPSDLEKMTANLKGPFIINTVTRQAMQVIVENPEYKVKFNAYEAIQEMKKKAGE